MTRSSSRFWGVWAGPSHGIAEAAGVRRETATRCLRTAALSTCDRGQTGERSAKAAIAGGPRNVNQTLTASTHLSIGVSDHGLFGPTAAGILSAVRTGKVGLRQ